MADELLAGSGDFARLWNSHELRVDHHNHQKVQHPQVGPIPTAAAGRPTCSRGQAGEGRQRRCPTRVRSAGAFMPGCRHRVHPWNGSWWWVSPARANPRSPRP
ncbi:hypothetical protein ABT404_44590 [Streptomyces hyaluromycini]|uniref:MmyB-like transcription regulator ligand binding domain-containing protein n=1 Tax=Streptomyces hyaluromycini TaxID=1377993 RepID=A0ABV1XBU1_9ACTN